MRVSKVIGVIRVWGFSPPASRLLLASAHWHGGPHDTCASQDRLQVLGFRVDSTSKNSAPLRETEFTADASPETGPPHARRPGNSLFFNSEEELPSKRGLNNYLYYSGGSLS